MNYKRPLRILKRTALTLLSLVGLYLLAALVLGLMGTDPPAHTCTVKDQIFLSSNGIHMDLLIKRRDLNAQLSSELPQLKGWDYVGFGWGDEGFYRQTPQWDDLSFGTALKALFVPSSTVMHLTEHRSLPAESRTVSLCSAQLELLQDYIENSFQRDSTQAFICFEGAGYTPHDYFYAANGSYHLIKNCNEWVNRGLKAANVRTALWSPFDYGIFYHVDD